MFLFSSFCLQKLMQIHLVLWFALGGTIASGHQIKDCTKSLRKKKNRKKPEVLTLILKCDQIQAHFCSMNLLPENSKCFILFLLFSIPLFFSWWFISFLGDSYLFLMIHIFFFLNKEWPVTKINKRGKRQRRIFGVDMYKIYNHKLNSEFRRVTAFVRKVFFLFFFFYSFIYYNSYISIVFYLFNKILFTTLFFFFFLELAWTWNPRYSWDWFPRCRKWIYDSISWKWRTSTYRLWSRYTLWSRCHNSCNLLSLLTNSLSFLFFFLLLLKLILFSFLFFLLLLKLILFL